MDAVMSERGQTSFGSIFAVAMTVLAITGAVTISYAFIGSPALNGVDTTAESSLIAEDISYNTLSLDESEKSSIGPILDPNKVEDFFINNQSTAATTHPVATERDLGVNVTINRLAAPDQSSSIINSTTLYAGNELEYSDGSTVSQYYEAQKTVILEGDVAIIEVRTWEK